ncbi:UNVERIFIED_CONTAM: hypothetical protein Scaly_0907000 [Sesamum calycinum]|uniref:SWIM-type domain-containing protein n=1 Tax=Sesamum calycinum TaxID=2727403 RepID=A0AAW2QWY8_9LAMI
MKLDDWHFQIMGLFDQHNVDLLNRSCNCRRWDLTGIPCIHTISAIWCRNEDPQDYVHDVYKVSTYLRCYEHAIQGVNGAELWLKCHNARTCNKSSGQAEEMAIDCNNTSKKENYLKSGSKNVGLKLCGKSNNMSSINVTQSSRINSPVIVKGGMNFITLPNLKATLGTQQIEKGQSSRDK